MPHAIFFTTRGHSIHGSDHPGLGTPVSHGCVRLSLTNATTLYDLVTAEGMGKTTVIVRGDEPPGYYTPSQPPQQKRPFAPFGGLFRFYESRAVVADCSRSFVQLIRAPSTSHLALAVGRSAPFDRVQSVTKARTGFR